MNGLTWSSVISAEFRSPHAAPASIAPATLATRECLDSSSCVPQIPAKAITDPTERSMPPEIMMIVMPSAMIVITAVWRHTLERFWRVRK